MVLQETQSSPEYFVSISLSIAQAKIFWVIIGLRTWLGNTLVKLIVSSFASLTVFQFYKRKGLIELSAKQNHKSERSNLCVNRCFDSVCLMVGLRKFARKSHFELENNLNYTKIPGTDMEQEREQSSKKFFFVSHTIRCFRV